MIDKRVGDVLYLAGEYSIADIATYPWLRPHKLQGQNLEDFPNLKRWYEAIEARPAVRKGMAVMADGPTLQPNDKETFSILYGAKQYERR